MSRFQQNYLVTLPVLQTCQPLPSAVIGILMTWMLLSPINALEVGKKLSEVLVLVYLYIQGLAWGYLLCKCVNYSLLFLRSCQKLIPKHNKLYLKTDNSDKQKLYFKQNFTKCLSTWSHQEIVRIRNHYLTLFSGTPMIKTSSYSSRNGGLNWC